MFGLTLVDHLRLTFGHVIYAHRAHSELALRHARWHRWLLAGEAILVFIAAMAAIAMTFTGRTPYGAIAAVTASAAGIALVLRLTVDFERSAHAHRVCGARLWRIREQYRAVLSDLKDDLLTVDAARERRDVLMTGLHAIYEEAPPADRAIYEAARKALPATDEGDLTDEEIDRFLPGSLQKGRRPA
jgi:hypothetical protein